MTAAPLPPNESERIDALRGLNLLDTRAEERFDRMTRLAQWIFDVPIALVSLVDSDRQWFKSCVGLDVSETPRAVSFCSHAILSDETFVIPDTLADPRFADNPLVTGAPYLRFYAGQPIHSPDGHRIGTFCIADLKPRSFSENDRASLQNLAVVVENELRLAREEPVHSKASPAWPVVPLQKMSRQRTGLFLALVIASGILVAVATFQHANRSAEGRTRAEFEMLAATYAKSVTGVFLDRQIILDALAGFFQASHRVERDEFRIFTAPLLALRTSIAALEWIPRVVDRDRDAFEARARAGGLANFRIRAWTASGDLSATPNREYFPVYFVEPRGSNRAAIGMNLASNTGRRAAMELARASGMAAATSRVPLIQDPSDHHGFVTFLPLYDQGSSLESVESRRHALAGYVAAVFRINALVQNAVANLPEGEIEFFIQDLDAPEVDQLICHYHPDSSGQMIADARELQGVVIERSRQNLGWSQLFVMAGRHYEIICVPMPAFLEKQRSSEPWILLIGGLLLTSLLTAFILSLIRRSENVERMVTERTSELTQEMMERQLNERRLATEDAITRALAESAALADAVPAVLLALCHYLDWDYAAFWMASPADGRLHCLETARLSNLELDEFDDATRGQTYIEGEGLPGIVWASKAPFWAQVLAESEKFIRAPEARKAGLKSGVYFPVLVTDDSFALIELISRHDRPADPDLLKLLSSLGSQIGQFVLRKEADGALYRALVLKQGILDSANHSIISTDTLGIIQTFNRAAEQWLGYRADEMIGKLTPAILHDADEVSIRAEVLTSELEIEVERGFEVFVAKARRGTVDENEWTYVRKDGSRFAVLLSVTALRDQVGTITGFLGVGTNIEERKRQEEALRAAKRDAEEANQAKSVFLANMSHELRTPLNSVIGFANVLLKNRSETPANQDYKFLSRIAANGKHLLKLINSILDLSKVEAGRMELELKSIAVGELVRETLEQMSGQVRDKDVVLKAEIPEHLDPLTTDPQKLRQVLINLVGNSLKFTEHGSITVRIVPDDGGRAARKLQVIDTGIGIPEDRQAAVFEAFQQADNSTARRYGGTGLGLTITRSLCELMGYTITLESQTGVGTTFTITL